MSLRIIAGSHGGRRLRAPPGRHTRPTSERVREAWFAALGNAVVDARVLDLFAGSGALGIEALSRGARAAHFVEFDRRAVAALRENLEALGLMDRAVVVRADAFAFLSRPDRPSFDLALADPPYATDAAARLRARFETRPFARELWLEHAAEHEELARGSMWTRRYGDTRVSGYRAGASTQPSRAGGS